MPALSRLSWSHVVELLSVNDYNEVNYYINVCLKQNLGYRELGKKIKRREYENLSEKTRIKLIEKQELSLLDEVKDVIFIDKKDYKEKLSEFALKEIILNELDKFLKDLGNGFCYIGSEYKIKLGNNYNYIDILLYNLIYKSYVVVELKIDKLKKEHIGQIQVCMNYIDENVKQINDNKTIGLLVVRENDEYIIKYSSDKRIKAVKYILT